MTAWKRPPLHGHRLHFPCCRATLITAAGFLPVGFANSAAGEYAGAIFWVVGISLICSWLVAVMFTPYLGVKFAARFERQAHGRT